MVTQLKDVGQDKNSLHSRHLGVVGERENGYTREGDVQGVRERPFFLVPTTSKRLLRRLG